MAWRVRPRAPRAERAARMQEKLRLSASLAAYLGCLAVAFAGAFVFVDVAGREHRAALTATEMTAGPEPG